MNNKIFNNKDSAVIKEDESRLPRYINIKKMKKKPNIKQKEYKKPDLCLK